VCSREDTPEGRAKAGGFGWRAGKGLALGLLQPDHAAKGVEVKVRVLGGMHPRRAVLESPYDPDNEKLRA